MAVLALGAAEVALSRQAHAGKDLDAITKRGELICGVNIALAGFSAAGSDGKWTGMDGDVCRSVAATILKDPNNMRYVPLNAQQRFTALQCGEIDLLAQHHLDVDA